MENMSKDSAYNNQQPHERDSNPLCRFDVNVRLEKQDRVLIIEVYVRIHQRFRILGDSRTTGRMLRLSDKLASVYA